jgi:hypothetical protein
MKNQKTVLAVTASLVVAGAVAVPLIANGTKEVPAVNVETPQEQVNIVTEVTETKAEVQTEKTLEARLISHENFPAYPWLTPTEKLAESAMKWEDAAEIMKSLYKGSVDGLLLEVYPALSTGTGYKGVEVWAGMVSKVEENGRMAFASFAIDAVDGTVYLADMQGSDSLPRYGTEKELQADSSAYIAHANSIASTLAPTKNIEKSKAVFFDNATTVDVEVTFDDGTGYKVSVLASGDLNRAELFK